MEKLSLRTLAIELLVLVSGIPLAILISKTVYYHGFKESLWAMDGTSGFSPWWTGLFFIPWLINLIRILLHRPRTLRINISFWVTAVGLLFSLSTWYNFVDIRTNAFWVLPLPNQEGPFTANFNYVHIEKNVLLISMVVVGSITLLIAGFALFNFLGKRTPSQKDTDQDFHADH